MVEVDVDHELVYCRHTLPMLPQAINLRLKRDATSLEGQEVEEGTSMLMGRLYQSVAQVPVVTITLGLEAVLDERTRQTAFNQSHTRGRGERAGGKFKERK